MSGNNRAARGSLPLPRDQAYYNKGRELYASKEYEAARQAFQKAVAYCVCGKSFRAAAKELGLPVDSIAIPKCVCKIFSAKDIKSPRQAGFYAIAKAPCHCGSGIKHCDSPIHIKALDGAAAACESLKEFGAAYDLSVLLIIIAPNQPEGYLRMGKVMRLLPKPAPLQESCIVYKQGIRSVCKFGDRKHPKLAVLSRLLDKVNKTDIAEKLPTELIAMIFSHLSMRDLCRAMLVSKDWRHQVLNAHLWKHLDFNRCKGVSMKTLTNVLSKRAQSEAESIRIRDAKKFGLNLDKVNMMLHNAPKLRKFWIATLQMHPSPLYLQKTGLPYHMPELTTLCLDYIFDNFDSSHLMMMLHRAAPTLKELSLSFYQTPSSIWLEFPEMLNLETLQLSHKPLYGERVPMPHSINEMRHLSIKTPNVRRLRLDRDTWFPVDDATQSMTLDTEHWQQLEDLALAGLILGRVEPHEFAFDFQLTNKLKRLDLCDLGLLFPQFVVNGDLENIDSAAFQRFENLEHFRENSAMRLSLLRQVLAPSVANRTLRGLELNYQSSVAEVHEIVGLSSLDFLHKEDIEVLGLTNFLFPNPDDRAPGGRDSPSFLTWVATFPNLHTIVVYPFKFPDVQFLIEGLVGLGIKTIITDVLVGVERARILGLAKDKGVTIIHEPRSNAARSWRTVESQW